jgi:hypothetical protein
MNTLNAHAIQPRLRPVLASLSGDKSKSVAERTTGSTDREKYHQVPISKTVAFGIFSVCISYIEVYLYAGNSGNFG